MYKRCSSCIKAGDELGKSGTELCKAQAVFCLFVLIKWMGEVEIPGVVVLFVGWTEKLGMRHLKLARN